MKDAIDDTVALLAPQKSMRDVSLALDVATDLPAVALSREHLVQVLLNLVLNAAGACAAGGHVTVRAVRAAPGVRISVDDDDSGVPEDIRDRIFEPFVTTKEVGKGTGLGLAVCRGLVEAAGGTIELDTTHTRREHASSSSCPRLRRHDRVLDDLAPLGALSWLGVSSCGLRRLAAPTNRFDDARRTHDAGPQGMSARAPTRIRTDRPRRHFA